MHKLVLHTNIIRLEGSPSIIYATAYSTTVLWTSILLDYSNRQTRSVRNTCTNSIRFFLHSKNELVVGLALVSLVLSPLIFRKITSGYLMLISTSFGNIILQGPHVVVETSRTICTLGLLISCNRLLHLKPDCTWKKEPQNHSHPSETSTEIITYWLPQCN